MAPVSGTWFFMVFVMSVVLITAGGNVINDYFDLKTDAINDPDHVIVGTELDRRVAIYGHQFLTMGGVVLGLWYGWRTDTWEFVVIHIFAALSLWYYSTYFKKRLVIGNLVIAFLTGLVPVATGIFEIIPLIHLYGRELMEGYAHTPFTAYLYFKVLFFWIGGFAFFAFLSNLIREIIKDLEDQRGDAAIGRRTMPLVIGENNTRIAVTVLMAILMAGLLVVQQRYLNNGFTMRYFGLGLALPGLLALYFLWRGKDKQGYKRASVLLKVLMLIGLAYALFIKQLYVFT